MNDAADFRSDTVTLPTPAMRRAMAEAEVGDDVLGEDPTIRELEKRVAAMLGKDASLFVPSGTMANQVAIHVHCRAGDELICEERSHVFSFEGGAPARFSGVQVRPLAGPRGFPTAAAVRAAIRSEDPHHPRSRLLVLENTHNMAGGTVLDAGGVAELAAVAREAGLSVHVDGARLWNAAVALGIRPADLAAPVDSVSVCLSKGLGAPVGSLVAGAAEFVKRARRARKAFGGGMRQAGVLAAAGLVALEEGIARLAEDHRRARELAAGLDGIAGLRALPPETNIVMVDVESGLPDDLLTFLAERGVRAASVGPRRIRFVTHRDIGDAHVERCIRAATQWAATTSRGTPT